MQTKKKTATATRFVCLLLSLVLVATMVPAIAFATGGEEPVSVGNEQGLEGGAGEVTGGTEGASSTSGAGTIDGAGGEEGAGGEGTDSSEESWQEDINEEGQGTANELEDSTGSSESILSLQSETSNDVSLESDVVTLDNPKEGLISVSMQTSPNPFRTYTDKEKQANTPIGKLLVGLSVNMTEANIAGGSIEIPLDYAPTKNPKYTSGSTTEKPYLPPYENFTMSDDFFLYDSYTGAEGLVDSITTIPEDDTDPENVIPKRLLITLKDSAQAGTYSLNLFFSFNPVYDGMVPGKTKLWIVAPKVYVGDRTDKANLVSAPSPSTVIASDTTSMTYLVGRQSPSDETWYSGGIHPYVYFNNHYYYNHWFDKSFKSYLYIEVPTKSVVTNAVKNYFTESVELDDGYTRYYRYVEDNNDKKDWNTWWGNSNPATVHYLWNTTAFTPPASTTDNQDFYFRYGAVVKRANDAVEESGGSLKYTKKSKDTWAISLPTSHHTGSGEYSMVVNDADAQVFSNARYGVIASGRGYGYPNELYNNGLTPITGVSLILYQDSTDASKLNFKSISAIATMQNGTTDPQNYFKVEFRISSAIGEDPRIVETDVFKSSTDLVLPSLNEGEYINEVALIPMGDGTQEGVLLPSNGCGFRYSAAAWGTSTWPDGKTHIPEYTEVFTRYKLNYNDANGTAIKDWLGNRYKHYYVSSDYSNEEVYFISDAADNAEAGKQIQYTIRATNHQYYSANEWKNPFITVRVPQFMTYVGKKEIKLEDMSGSTYPVVVSQADVNENGEDIDSAYNYYSFQVGGDYSAGWNGTGFVFSIPALFKIAEGAPAATYDTMRVYYSTSDHSKFRKIRGKTESGSAAYAAAGFGQETDKFQISSGGYITPLTIIEATDAQGATEVKSETTDNKWVSSDFVAAAKGDEVDMKMIIKNTGNTTMSSVKLYDILPGLNDGRESTGGILFTGVSGVENATVYYWKGEGAPPAYDPSLNIQNLISETGASNWTTESSYAASAKAVYIDFGAATLPGAETMEGILSFKIPTDAGDQVAVNDFMFSAIVGGVAQNYKTPSTTFSTMLVTLKFDGNKPVSALGNVENIPGDIVQTINVDTEPFAIPSTTPTLDDYTFTGWNTQADGKGTSYQANGAYPMSDEPSNHTLYAQWTRNTYSYTVEYYHDSISSENLIGTAVSGKSKFISGTVLDDDTIATELGEGWLNMKKPATGDYKDGVYQDAPLTITSTESTNVVKVLYTKNTYGYTIKYYKGTSSGSLLGTNQGIATFVEGHELTSTDIDGDFPLGWLDAYKPQEGYASGAYANGNLSISSDASKNIVVVVYIPLTFEISFDSKGANEALVLDALKLNASFEAPIASTSGFPNNPTKNGYEFTGWTVSSASITDSPLLTNSLVMPAEPVLLSANWTPTPYNITYKEVPSGATNTNPATYTIESNNITFSDLAQNARPGYTFIGWNIAKDDDANGANSVGINIADTPGNNTKGVVLETGSYGHITATALWSINDYTVSFNLNGGANSAADYSELTVTYNSVIRSVAGFPADPAKTGYTFAGWKMSTTGTPLLASTTPMPAENITLTAQWDPAGVSYTVYHHRVDANGSVSATEKETRTALTGSTVNAQAKNYAPSHTYNATYQGTVATGTVQADGTLVLRLYYPINRYTVTFVDWNGSVLASRSVPHGGSALAPSNPYRAGYTFQGWDKTFTNVTSNLTVNARYTIIPIATYTVTFVDWDGSVLSSQTITRGGSATAPANPTRTGYTFTGWDRGYTNVTSNITVTAQYTPVEVDTFTITFISYGDTVLQSSTVERGGSVTPPADPTRTGYTFTGWDRTSSAWTNVTADATIRATWDDGSFVTTPTIIDPDDDTPITIEEFVQAAEEQGIPSIGIPLAAPAGFAAWALANLILAVLSVMLALVFAILRRSKKNDDDDEEEREQRRRERAAQYGQEHVYAAEEDEQLRRRRGIGWIIATIIAALAGAILFILTQDITLPMVWVDMWTIVNGILFVATLVLGSFAIGRKKADSKEEDDSAAAQTV